jgi:hypothetical protein
VTGYRLFWCTIGLNSLRMIKTLLIVQIIVFSGSRMVENPDHYQGSDIRQIYQKCGLTNVISYNVFELALTGLQKISKIRNKKIITIIDFSKPSTKQRLFVIDLENNHILFQTLVAHGRNSGENMAEKFSNDSKSLKSCLGFFLTAETYNGKHGYSLSLDGLEPGINDNARKRTIVIHGADYVSNSFAQKYGRIGRSWGCPALPSGISKEIIDKIKNGSCLFIYGNDPDYLKESEILN